MILKITDNNTWGDDTQFKYVPEMEYLIGGYIDTEKLRFVNKDFETLDNTIQINDEIPHVWDKSEDIWKCWMFCNKMYEEVTDAETLTKINESITEFLSNLTMCRHCHEYVASTTEDGWCSDCDAERSTCPHCGDRYITSDMVWSGSEDAYMCEDCRDEAYTYCSDCEEYVLNDDFDFDNDSCHHCATRRTIRSYDYRPSTLHFTKSDKETERDLYFGVEVEVDQGGEDGESAKQLKQYLDELVYFKHDGSLDEGFEIITHPMHYNAIMERKQAFENMFKHASDMGYRSHDTSTCGLHIHMSSTYFQPEDKVKLVYLYEKFWDEFVKFSRRRNGGNLQQYAKRYGSEQVEDIEKIDIKTQSNQKIRDLRDNGRYVAVNLTNDSTIEIRINRGTLNIETFIASIQLCYHLAKVVTKKDIDELRLMTWNDLTHGTEFEELNSYLVKREL